MNRMSKFAVAALIAAALVPAVAQAHRQWILPSGTVLSGNGPWVTFDAAVSTELFFFDAAPMRLADVAPPQGMPAMPGANLRVTTPDGMETVVENAATGRLRSVFDLRLTQNGTYKVAATNQGAFATYKVDGQAKRWRGAVENMAKEIPANAQEVQLTETASRIETFVTLGKPNETAFKTTGVGLELVPVTHPNNLFVGDKATFKILLDGKPARDVEVEIVPGGNRYRFKLGDSVLRTGADGSFTTSFADPGMYWVGMDIEDDNAKTAGAKRRANYAVTLEVLQ